MKLLLDTHIWIWLLQDPTRLHRNVLRELRDKNNEIWLSPISTWEALTLHRKNRIRLHHDLREWVTLATTGTQEAPLTHEVMVTARMLPLHEDPADRILAATAQVMDLTLITSDEKLLGLGTIKILSNR